MVQAQDRRREGRGRDDRRRGPRRDRPGDDFVEKVVAINRVAKVVKGGRRFSFTAVMVVGDGNGRVGIGMGRANEVPEAIRKGATIARRNMITVPIRNGTIPHPLTTDFGAARVMLKPASAGTGVIAGGGVRAIMEAAGIRNVLTKSLGSNNVINVVRATMVALEKLRDPRRVRQERLRLAGLIPTEELADPDRHPRWRPTCLQRHPRVGRPGTCCHHTRFSHTRCRHTWRDHHTRCRHTR